MALRRTRASWWRRNRWWLLALVPLLAAALAASSWHWWTIYRPSQFSVAHRPVDSRVHLVQDVNLSGHKLPIDVTLRVEDHASAPALGGYHPSAPGLVVQQVSVTFEADPEQPLVGCQLVLRDSDGAQYLPGVGLVADKGNKTGIPPNTCVEALHAGPVYDPITGDVGDVLPGEDRPESWTISYLFALPADRTPQELRVVYDLPDYVALPLS